MSSLDEFGAGSQHVLAALPSCVRESGECLLRAGRAVRDARRAADTIAQQLQSNAVSRVATVRGQFETRVHAAIDVLTGAVARSEGGISADFEPSAQQLVQLWDQYRRDCVAIAQARDQQYAEASSTRAVAAAENAFREALQLLEGALHRENHGNAPETIVAEDVAAQVPWQLRYSDQRNPDEEGAPVDFSGGELKNASGVGIFQDVCCACGDVIQEGALRGRGAPRIHCLDCTDTSICAFCDTHLRRAAAACELAACVVLTDIERTHGHLRHRCVLEYDQQVLQRLSVFETPCLQTVTARAFATYAARPCFGSWDAAQPEREPVYNTFREEAARVAGIADVVRRACVVQSRVGVLVSRPRLAYEIEMAVTLRNCVSGGLAHDCSLEYLVSILARTEVALLFASSDLLSRVTGRTDIDAACDTLLHMLPGLQHVALVPSADDFLNTPAPSTAQQLPRVFEMKAFTPNTPPDLDTLVVPGHDTEKAVITYSSGTSGEPKGVMFTNRQFLRDQDQPYYNRPLVDVSFLPPYWATDKAAVWRAFLNGGAVAFAAVSFDRTFEAIRAIAPTGLALLPAHGYLLRAEYMRARELLRSEGAVDADAAAASATRALLGHRCRAIGIGGARVPPALEHFLRSTLAPILLVNTYGSTESSGITADGRARPGVRIKLLDRSDIGYSFPPRGEVCVKTDAQVGLEQWVCSDEQRSALAARYMSDGWFRTGDIAELQADGTYHVIDRATSTLKLANGRFVSPESIEDKLSPLLASHVAMFIVCANDDSTALLVIAVALHKGADVVSFIKSAISSADLLSYERPQHVLVDPEAWSPANGCMTPSMKVLRHAIRARHSRAIAELTVSGAVSISDDDTPFTIDSAAILELIASHLRLTVSELAMDEALISQGADSLTLLKLVSALPFHRACSLSELAATTPRQVLEQRRLREITLEAMNADITNFVMSLRTEKSAAASADGVGPPYIVVTGAAGFLGSAVVATLLESSVDAVVVCVVRSASDAGASERQRTALLQHMPADEVDKAIMTERLHIARGDVARPLLGWSLSVYDTHASRATCVIHTAAVVKFLSKHAYAGLARTNVGGAVEALRFARACRRRATLIHVSTQSVTQAKCVSPDGLLRGSIDHMDAYTLTKAMAECVLMGAAAHTAVSIIRPPLITWSSTGVCNPDDWLMRLLLTCKQMRSWPQAPSASPLHMLHPFMTLDACASAIAARALSHVPPSVDAHTRSHVHVHDMDARLLSAVDVIAAAVGIAAAHGEPWTGEDAASWLRRVESAEAPFAQLAPSFRGVRPDADGADREAASAAAHDVWLLGLARALGWDA